MMTDLNNVPLDQTETVYGWHKTVYEADLAYINQQLKLLDENPGGYLDFSSRLSKESLKATVEADLEKLEVWYQGRTQNDS
jgi:hypothetical protein